MEYLIEGKVVYRCDDHSLRLIESGDVVTLTLPAARLLEILLDSGGQILERTDLLVSVWDKYGLEGSNSNLNNYISLLRRTFATYGINDLIITIPKVGFKLNESIEISKDNHARAEEEHYTASIKGIRVTHLMTALAVAYVIIIVAAITLSLKNNETEEIAFTDISTGPACDITLLNNVENSSKKEYAKVAMNIIKEKGVACDVNKRIYFHFMQDAQYNSLGRILLAVCSRGKNKSNDLCQTYNIDPGEVSNENRQ